LQKCPINRKGKSLTGHQQQCTGRFAAPGLMGRVITLRNVPDLAVRKGTMKHTHGLAILTTLRDVCHPQRMALLVYDMQIGIWE
jgi:hypothetical protein